MTYEHTVHVYELADAPAPGSPGAPDADTGWGDAPADPAQAGGAVAPGAVTVYDGPADVQDGQRTLARLADLGESERATAVVYLPPAAAQAFAAIEVGHLVTTPLGSGEVVGLMQTDAALAVALTRSAGAVPVVLN